MRKFLPVFVYFILFIISSLLFTRRSLAVNTPQASTSALVATTPGSDTVQADGVTMASMTATLKDFQGIPATGDAIALSAPSDIYAVFSPTTAILNAQGIATFSAVSTHVGTDAITVTDTTASTVLTALGNIIFTEVQTPTPTPTGGDTPIPTPTSAVCSGSTSDPPDAPDLYAILASIDSATIYFVPPKKAYTGFTINYGLTNAANMYAVQFTQNSSDGAISYQINSLTSGQTYYFRVRGNNQCATGTWSQTVGSFIGDSSLTSTPSGSLLPDAGSNLASILVSVGGVSILGGLALILLL